MEREKLCPLTKEELLAEIEEEKLTDPTLLTYLNNFYANLPNQVNRRYAEYSKLMDTLGAEFLKSDGQFTVYGERILSLTPRMFFMEIDEVLKEYLEDHKRLDELLKKPEINIQDINNMLVPVYIELRLRGYKHYPDLTA